MLYTNLKHIESTQQLTKVISENKKLVIICGRMGMMSIPMYRIIQELEDYFPEVKFFDMEYDNPESEPICRLSAEHGLKGLPVIVYYKEGRMVGINSGVQAKDQLIENIELNFRIKENA
ncbi:thioredoxin family protein [Sunxiuqinia sp. A32]|uniref:thioredoxin family protein n=1 Tax=Sunxiuqinia sp. A32 TaxID=3461496 RepID=UPI00404607C7